MYFHSRALTSIKHGDHGLAGTARLLFVDSASSSAFRKGEAMLSSSQTRKQRRRFRHFRLTGLSNQSNLSRKSVQRPLKLGKSTNAVSLARWLESSRAAFDDKLPGLRAASGLHLRRLARLKPSAGIFVRATGLSANMF